MLLVQLLPAVTAGAVGFPVRRAVTDGGLVLPALDRHRRAVCSTRSCPNSRALREWAALRVNGRVRHVVRDAMSGPAGIGHLDGQAARDAADLPVSDTGAINLGTGVESRLWVVTKYIGALAAAAPLSGGQWQKVAIARSMTGGAPLLLVLDEPTAALDPIAEHALYERHVGAAARVRDTGGVVLLVSHRFASVRMADPIVVLNAGAVEDTGTRDEPMAGKGSYPLMYRQQAAALG